MLTEMSPMRLPELPPEAENRETPRFALLLRIAKLAASVGEYICVIRDVSVSGLRLKLFHRLPPEQRLDLVLANGLQYRIEVVWQREGEAGFRFLDAVDVEAFLAEASPFPRRPLRLHFQVPAMVVAGSMRGAATIHDISQQGTRFESGLLLMRHQPIQLEVRGLPALSGHVRWARGSEYGVIFERSFRLDELARHAGHLIGSPTPRRAPQSPGQSAGAHPGQTGGWSSANAQ